MYFLISQGISNAQYIYIVKKKKKIAAKQISVFAFSSYLIDFLVLLYFLLPSNYIIPSRVD